MHKKVRGDFIFYFKKQDSLLVQRLMDKIETPLKNIEKFFTRSSDSPVTVLIIKSETEFRKYFRNQIPEWSQAIAMPEERSIVLKLANADQIKKSPQILLHEIVHVLVFDYTRGRTIPTWLNEGLAEYFSEGTLSFDKKILLADAIVQKRVLDFTAIDTLAHLDYIRARLAYIQAQSAVVFLVDRYGRAKLHDLLSYMAENHTFYRAFKKIYGFDFLDFEIQWNEYIYKRYRWLVLLKFEQWLFAAIGILFIIAVIIVYLKNKKKIRELEEQEVEPDDQIDGGL
ncbi:MAG: hypothetical protein GXO77_07875 [Calditrichaeota bacterium]|nr:hypothetical protein [Calditrichota bacterium]